MICIYACLSTRLDIWCEVAGIAYSHASATLCIIPAHLETCDVHLMHMAHLSGNTSVLSKSSSDWLNYTGFPGDVCVVFFIVPSANKDSIAPKFLTKAESRCVYRFDGERLSG